MSTFHFHGFCQFRYKQFLNHTINRPSVDSGYFFINLITSITYLIIVCSFHSLPTLRTEIVLTSFNTESAFWTLMPAIASSIGFKLPIALPPFVYPLVLFDRVFFFAGNYRIHISKDSIATLPIASINFIVCSFLSLCKPCTPYFEYNHDYRTCSYVGENEMNEITHRLLLSSLRQIHKAHPCVHLLRLPVSKNPSFYHLINHHNITKAIIIGAIKQTALTIRSPNIMSLILYSFHPRMLSMLPVSKNPSLASPPLLDSC